MVLSFSEAHSKRRLKTGSDDYIGCVFQAMLSGSPNGVEAEKELGAVSSAGERRSHIDGEELSTGAAIL